MLTNVPPVMHWSITSIIPLSSSILSIAEKSELRLRVRLILFLRLKNNEKLTLQSSFIASYNPEAMDKYSKESKQINGPHFVFLDRLVMPSTISTYLCTESCKSTSVNDSM